MTGRVLYEKNQHVQLPLASLTKLMTVLVALDAVSLDESIIISEDALAPEGDSGLLANEWWNVQDLIDFTLIGSSNDGARALALAANSKVGGASIGNFVFKMNDKRKMLNMSETFFINVTGLGISTTTAGALGSACDMAILLASIYATAPDAFLRSSLTDAIFTIGDRIHDAENTNSISESI